MAEFPHLQVASGYSLRYGAASPDAIVQRALELGMDTLALTDRDGLFGAVRFVNACTAAGISPVLGVNLPIRDEQPTRSRTPAAGGDIVDSRAARITLLAQGAGGMVALNRLVTASSDLNGVGPTELQQAVEIADQASGRLVLLLGPDSDVGRALARRRPDQAAGRLHHWRQTGAGLHLEVVSHLARDQQAVPTSVHGASHHGLPLSTPAAARMWRFAIQEQLPAVLTNAVRYLSDSQARVADVLDASRRLVPLSGKQVDRPNNQGYLKSTTEMAELLREIAAFADLPAAAAAKLWQQTFDLAAASVLDPQLDLGIGTVHVPELDVILAEKPLAAVNLDWHRPPAPRRTAGQIAAEAAAADRVLRSACEAGLERPDLQRRTDGPQLRERLESELQVIAGHGFAAFFLTVAEVVNITKRLGVRVAARGSGAGSLVNHLLGISVLNPLDHDLIMERFLSPLRSSLPDIDIDVESHRRLEVYDAVFERFGGDRVACVSMMETYRVRHAIRDVGRAVGLPPGEIDVLAKSFPHIRARDAKLALAELPELRGSSIGQMAQAGRLERFLDLVAGLDGLPRDIAMHPCGVLLSDSALLDRTPVQQSAGGYPMSHYDKDDVETLGFLKLDILGIRMQSAMSHAVAEITRVSGEQVELDALPLDDSATFELIRSTRTLGCFQIESPGQRELVGKFAPETFNDIIIDISLFRPGPVKSDMITPFLNARQGWRPAEYLHPDLRPALQQTSGVVVFHEQVIAVVSVMTGCTLAQADEVRRSMGNWDQQPQLRSWFYSAALRSGYDLDVVDRVWEVLRAFASFGFCKAHAGAFAVPTYQSAWLKAHHPAAFYAGVLTHDPGMYPRRLILDDARQFGVPVLGLDVNHSKSEYAVEESAGRLGIRIPFSQVKGISGDEVASLVAAQPFQDMNDVWQRSEVSRPTMERLVLAGGLDSLHAEPGRPANRRDLLVHVAELERWRGRTVAVSDLLFTGEADRPQPTGLADLSPTERLQAELEILEMDVSRHVLDFHAPLLAALGVVPAKELLNQRNGREILIAGVKVATQTPPVRSGKRVIFLTMDDGTGPLDAAFFEDAQGEYAATLFQSWTLLVRGVLRRTGPRGVSIRATGCWELDGVQQLFDQSAWASGVFRADRGAETVFELLSRPIEAMPPAPDRIGRGESGSGRRAGGMGSRVLVHPSGFRMSPWADIVTAGNLKPPTKLWHTSPGSPG